jgi:hypothetical protein
MNPKNTISRLSTVPAAVSFAALVTIQFLTILSAYASFHEIIATNNITSAAIPSNPNTPIMSAP